MGSWAEHGQVGGSGLHCFAAVMTAEALGSAGVVLITSRVVVCAYAPFYHVNGGYPIHHTTLLLQSSGGFYKCNKFKGVAVEEAAGMGDAAKAKAGPCSRT